jgi:hypothetical protein
VSRVWGGKNESTLFYYLDGKLWKDNLHNKYIWNEHPNSSNSLFRSESWIVSLTVHVYPIECIYLYWKVLMSFSLYQKAVWHFFSAGV